jgi:hypothetical protein
MLSIARRNELRELAESSESQISELQKSLSEQSTLAQKCKTELQTVETELERLSPFEKEVKEKNLLIGKLRHEAVILNDHLTKALRFLKRGKPEDNVDRRIVTNHFLQFLALDRSDPKKFQVLLLIAALLQWSDDQKEQAGLSRPGTGSTLSAPLPSFSLLRKSSSSNMTLNNPKQRTGSTSGQPLGSPTASGDGAMASPSKESLAELWSNFLEQEAAGSSSSTAQKK